MLGNSFTTFISYSFCLLQEQNVFALPPVSLLGSISAATPFRSNAPSIVTNDSMPAAVVSTTGSVYKDKLIAALNIPVELANHTDVNLGFAWQKYKACLAAYKACNTL
jgi:hypothetical protein